MPVYIKNTSVAMSFVALAVSVLAVLFAVSQASTPCAYAASGSCSVGDNEIFSSDIGIQSDTAFTYTFGHGITADRVIQWPDAQVLTGSLLTGSTTDTLGVVLVGSDGEVPRADSTQAGGITWTDGARHATGEYTGDGATSFTPTDACGFQPTYVEITLQELSDNGFTESWYTTVEILDDNAAGGAIFQDPDEFEFRLNAIIAFTSTSFTVDDKGGDQHPNKSASIYNYRCAS